MKRGNERGEGGREGKGENSQERGKGLSNATCLLKNERV